MSNWRIFCLSFKTKTFTSTIKACIDNWEKFAQNCFSKYKFDPNLAISREILAKYFILKLGKNKNKKKNLQGKCKVNKHQVLNMEAW
jgi:hypothetical protein